MLPDLLDTIWCGYPLTDWPGPPESPDRKKKEMKQTVCWIAEEPSCKLPTACRYLPCLEAF